jgi:hypothetical protein
MSLDFILQPDGGSNPAKLEKLYRNSLLLEDKACYQNPEIRYARIFAQEPLKDAAVILIGEDALSVVYHEQSEADLLPLLSQLSKAARKHPQSAR